MKPFLIALAAAVILTGCAATVKPVTTPNGQQGFYIECGGSAEDWTSCYQAAAKVCRGKYTIIDRQQSSTATTYGLLVTRELIIECRTLQSLEQAG